MFGLCMQVDCLRALMESADPVPHSSPGLFCPVHISGLAGRGLTCLPSRRVVPYATQWLDSDLSFCSRVRIPVAARSGKLFDDVRFVFPFMGQ